MFCAVYLSFASWYDGVRSSYMYITSFEMRLCACDAQSEAKREKRRERVGSAVVNAIVSSGGGGVL